MQSRLSHWAFFLDGRWKGYLANVSEMCTRGMVCVFIGLYQYIAGERMQTGGGGK